jgi:hypothetical protein
MLNKICTWPSFAKASEGKDGKKCAIPSFSGRKKSSAKESGQVDRPELRRVTQPPFIAGPI